MEEDTQKVETRNKNNKNNGTNKSKKGIIICVIVIFIFLALIIAAKFIKDNNGISYLDKFKSLFIIQDNPDLETEKTDITYSLNDYLAIEEKIGRDENFKYEQIVFTKELPEDLYKEFIEIQEEFMDSEVEQYYVRRELITSAEIYNNILYILSVQTSYTQDMPVVDSFYTLTINLENKKALSNNDVIAIFEYNLEGVFYKVLEDLIENTNADHYYLSDEVTTVTKEEFRKNIPVYAQTLSKEEIVLAKLYIQKEKLYVGYIESSILSFLDLTYDRFIINETVNSFELVIINNTEESIPY